MKTAFDCRNDPVPVLVSSVPAQAASAQHSRELGADRINVGVTAEFKHVLLFKIGTPQQGVLFWVREISGLSPPGRGTRFSNRVSLIICVKVVT
jgi:hypothetical protein